MTYETAAEEANIESNEEKLSFWGRILEVLFNFHHEDRCKEVKALRVHTKLLNINITTTGHTKMSSLTINDLQSDILTATLTDGVPSPVLGQTIVWTSSDTAGAVISVTPSADTYSATITAVGVGSATVTASVAGLTASFDYVVATSAPTTLTLTAGTPFLTSTLTAPAAPAAPAAPVATS